LIDYIFRSGFSELRWPKTHTTSPDKHSGCEVPSWPRPRLPQQQRRLKAAALDLLKGTPSNAKAITFRVHLSAFSIVHTAARPSTGPVLPDHHQERGASSGCCLRAGQFRSPYLKIIFHNDSAMTINRVVFEVHFSGAFGEFTATHAVPAAAGDLSVWSDAAFVREYGDALDLKCAPKR